MITESIFDGTSSIIPMADVQHIEKHWFRGDLDRTKTNYRGIKIITKHTFWDKEIDDWGNNIYLPKDEADAFIKAWCNYRSELENIEAGDTRA